MDYNCVAIGIAITVVITPYIVTLVQIYNDIKKSKRSPKIIGDVDYHGNEPYILGVCGATCSGKSTLCRQIIENIANQLELETEEDVWKYVVVISQDRYYKGGSNDTNYDEPNAIDFELLKNHLLELKSGKPIDAPNYDFTTHSRAKTTDTIHPAPIIIVEGILIFSVEKIRNILNKKLFVRAHRELRFYRRIKRDIKERGRKETYVVNRYFKDVLPSNNFHVEPSEDWSDIILVNNRPNEFIGMEFLLPFIKKIVDKHIKNNLQTDPTFALPTST